MKNFKVVYKLNDGTYFNTTREAESKSAAEQATLRYLHANPYVKMSNDYEKVSRFICPLAVTEFTIEELGPAGSPTVPHKKLDTNV